jgi:hypothetical protein
VTPVTPVGPLGPIGPVLPVRPLGPIQQGYKGAELQFPNGATDFFSCHDSNAVIQSPASSFLFAIVNQLSFYKNVYIKVYEEE